MFEINKEITCPKCLGKGGDCNYCGGIGEVRPYFPINDKRGEKTDEDKAFLDCLTDFLGDSEDQSKEEVKAELREQGIEIDDLTNNVKVMINQKICEIKRRWTESESQ